MIGYEMKMRGIPDRYEKQTFNIIWSVLYMGRENKPNQKEKGI